MKVIDTINVMNIFPNESPNESSIQFPYYYANKIKVINSSESIAIVTFWSQLSEYPIDDLRNYHYMSIGNLYTRDGFKYIILNSFLAPNLQYLVFTGNDRNDLSNCIHELFDQTTSSVMYRIMYQQLSLILDIERNSSEYVETNDRDNVVQYILTTFIKRFQHNYRIISQNEFVNQYKSIGSNISTIINPTNIKLVPKLYRCKLVVSSDKLPSESTGFVSRSNNLQHLWLLVMRHIKSFGLLRTANTEINDADYYEIIDAMYVLQHKDRNIDSIESDNQFPIDHDELERYIPQITTDNTFPGLAYTYGNRLHKRNDIDVYGMIIDKLVQSNMSRHAYISLYDTIHDINSANPPCLTDVVINVQNDMVILSAHFRSHDVFAAMRMNMYGLCMLQNKIVNDLNKKIGNKLRSGDVIIFANSCHIYVRDYVKLNNVKFITDCIPDMRGYFIISVDDQNNLSIDSHDRHDINSKVNVKHYDYDNVLLHDYKLSSPNDSQIDDIAYYVTNIHHAMYIQLEIDKAFNCIKNGTIYVQDS